jgi:hypothetical protein
MSKRAVLVGINYDDAPEDCPPLSGCVNDVWLLHELLLSKFGFAEEDITVLIDSDNDGTYSRPTGRNILVSCRLVPLRQMLTAADRLVTSQRGSTDDRRGSCGCRMP